jgi:uncharacterized iron-regulated protein
MPRLIAAMLVVLWAAMPQVYAAEPRENWQTSLHVNSEHAGTLWDTRAGEAVTPAEMVARLAEARFVLIGEVHDNPDHHRLQGWIIARLAEAGQSPTVVMEMISADKADALADYLAQPDATAAGLGPALNWGESGWPAWREYQPIAEAAFAAGLDIVAGNPTGAMTRETAQTGLDALGARKAALSLDVPLAPALSDALMDELYDGHCEMVPRERLSPMARVQRLRDAAMADAMLGAGDAAVLIAGNGHVRADRGVPWYLRARLPEASRAVVMHVELDGSGKAPADYVQRGPDDAPLADFVWLTPRAERPDPCEQMRQMMQQRSGN